MILYNFVQSDIELTKCNGYYPEAEMEQGTTGSRPDS